MISRRKLSRFAFVAAAIGVVLATVAAVALSVFVYQRTRDGNVDEAADSTPSPSSTKSPSKDPSKDPTKPSPEAGPSSVPLPAEGELSVLLLGDEIMSGVGASAVETRPYNLVTDAIGFQRIVDLIGPELSVGDTGVIEEATQDAAPYDLVVLQLGTEDMADVAPDEFTDAYQLLTEEARASSPKGALVCLGVWAGPGDADAYDKSIEASCVEAGGVYIDVSGIYKRADSRGPVGRDGLIDRDGAEGTIKDASSAERPGLFPDGDADLRGARAPETKEEWPGLRSAVESARSHQICHTGGSRYEQVDDRDPCPRSVSRRPDVCRPSGAGLRRRSGCCGPVWHR